MHHPGGPLGNLPPFSIEPGCTLVEGAYVPTLWLCDLLEVRGPRAFPTEEEALANARSFKAKIRKDPRMIVQTLFESWKTIAGDL